MVAARVAGVGQLPRSARGREACDGVPSVTEGARSRGVQPAVRAVLLCLLVSYMALVKVPASSVARRLRRGATGAER